MRKLAVALTVISSCKNIYKGNIVEILEEGEDYLGFVKVSPNKFGTLSFRVDPEDIHILEGAELEKALDLFEKTSTYDYAKL